MPFKSYKQQDITTVETLTPAAYPATVIGLTVANTHASSTATVHVYVTGNALTTYLIKNAKIPPGTSLAPIGGIEKLVLVDNGGGADDIINIVSDVAVDAIMSTLE